MKFMKRTKIYKASNVTFNPETIQAFSYNWWCFVREIQGKIVFNNYSYSPSTTRHQYKVCQLLRELNIHIDLEVDMKESLNELTFNAHALESLYRESVELSMKRDQAYAKARLEVLEERAQQLVGMGATLSDDSKEFIESSVLNRAAARINAAREKREAKKLATTVNNAKVELTLVR